MASKVHYPESLSFFLFMIGIYKITSPSGKIYIGQSVDIEQRFKSYSTANCRGQLKLYSSLKKYGVEVHTFEVVEECLWEELNVRERYWQDFYNVLVEGLNLQLTPTDELPRIHSEESRAKMSVSRTGKIQSEETRAKKRGRKWKAKMVTCPHCGKEGGETSMHQSHFDACLQNPEGPIGRRVISEEGKKNMGGSRGLAGKPKPKVTCPHCNKDGGGGVMKRYHFDNCKNKVAHIDLK